MVVFSCASENKVSEEGDEEIRDTQASDDPDGNGLSLLHEYAFRITPGAPDHPALLTLTRLPDQPAQATLQFDALSPLGGMDYFLESSPDPSSPSWERIAQDLQITPSGSSARYRLVTPVNGAPKRPTPKANS